MIPNGEDFICPRCGSIRRNRRLWKLLKDQYSQANLRILDFSPSRSIYRVMKKNYPYYTCTDISGDFIADYSYDIQNLDAENESYDLIIAYHILEHIPDDALAMSEMYRVLASGGAALIQTPFQEGGIYENPDITEPEDRLKHFGQEDHLRIYSVDGLQQRLESVGFRVEVLEFAPDEEQDLDLAPNEIVLRALKKKG